MEEGYPIDRKSPKERANFLSRLVFLWMKRICYEGCTQGLELRSLYKTQEHDKSAKLTNYLEKLWDKEIKRGKLKNKKPSLLRVLFKAYGLNFFYWGVITFLNDVVMRCLQPVLLSRLIKVFNHSRYNMSEVLYYGGGLCLITLIIAFLNQHTTCGVCLIGMRARVAVSSLIYRKILKLSQLSLGETAAGQVVNLLANDLARFDLVVIGLNYLWIGPIQIVIVGYLMWMLVGESSLAALIAILLMTLPLQLLMAGITSKYRTKVAERTDRRVKIMSELLAGIQVVKMYAWETAFESVVANSRKDEVKWLTKTSYARGILASFTIFVEKSTLCAMVVCFILTGHTIAAELVFSLVMYVDILNLTLAVFYPLAIAMTAESIISIKRLEQFLLMEEKEDTRILPSEDKSINLNNVDAFWIPEIVLLKKLSMKLAPGSLCAVIGPVGAGKSSFLKLLLGEMSASSGTIEFSGDISYASQEPWLFASTVRNNILFGRSMNRQHYKNIVRVCALERDFELLPEGDKTKVGDRGASLSGGQRARINLARCVYKDSDIYLLDDPLSAVDTKVGRQLFDQCIVSFLKGKTRILVTHQLQYLKKADKIIVLNKGLVEAQGTFQELSQEDLDFTKLLVASDETHEEQIEKPPRLSVVSSTTLTSSICDFDDEEDMEDKSGYKGSASWGYVRRFGGFITIAILILLFLLCQVVLTSTDYWLTYWASQNELRHKLQNNKETKALPKRMITKMIENISDVEELLPNIPRMIAPSIANIEEQFTERIITNDGEHILLSKNATMYVYIILVVILISSTLIRSTIFFYCCMRASMKLHNDMFHCLLETPMRFFDTNPAGRVLNRFSKDMGAVDELLPRALMDVIQILLVMCGILVLVAISNPYMIVVTLVLGLMFVQIRRWYIKTARAVKLIEGVAKSPVFSYINSSIDGLTTIRSSKNEEILKRQFDAHQDVHTSAWYLKILCGVAFGLWLDLICAIFVCFVICGFIVLDQFTNVQGSYIGLGISQASFLVGMLQYGMKQVAEVANYLTSVERILEYTQLEKEHPLTTPEGKKPEEPWPKEGHILFQNLSLKYDSTNPPVLNDLNFEVLAGEKIGIVGRTGAGKSSLIAALFRLAPLEGTILIDGVDTETLGLRDLRKRISIIPQEPVLFSATMRYNLDPFNEDPDEALWNALTEVELKDEINSLDFMITEGGNNFSVGQRQLVCLARAILRNNAVLVLDEATANVDPKTDQLIQKTIRKKFKNRTVLTVAHRLNTIMDSDKILVMDSGCKVEYDHAHILLQKPKGYFTNMLNETGPGMSQILKSVALDSYQSKRSK